MLVFLYSGLNHIVKILGLSHDSIGVPDPRCRTGWDSVLWVLSHWRAKLVCFPSLRCDSVWGLFYALNVVAQWVAGNVLVPFFSQWYDTARDCFVDDILLIFYSNHTNIQTTLDDFNTVHPSLKFTAEMETNSTINYLDVTIHKPPTGWRTSIYRKPTFTDTIIPYTSNHTTQHKYTAIKFYTTDWTHTTYRRLQARRKHCTRYRAQLFPDPPTRAIHLKAEKTSGNHTDSIAKVCHFHLYRKGNELHYKHFQMS